MPISIIGFKVECPRRAATPRAWRSLGVCALGTKGAAVGVQSLGTAGRPPAG